MLWWQDEFKGKRGKGWYRRLKSIARVNYEWALRCPVDKLSELDAVTFAESTSSGHAQLKLPSLTSVTTECQPNIFWPTHLLPRPAGRQPTTRQPTLHPTTHQPTAYYSPAYLLLTSAPYHSQAHHTTHQPWQPNLRPTIHQPTLLLTRPTVSTLQFRAHN